MAGTTSVTNMHYVTQDLLLSQQLANMWVLPLHEEEKRQACLSGFEKMTHEVCLNALLTHHFAFRDVV